MFKWLSKILIVTIITLITLILIKTNSDIKNVIYDNVYNTNINFAKLNKFICCSNKCSNSSSDSFSFIF